MHSMSEQEFRSKSPVLLTSVKIDGVLRGLLLDVVLEQRFSNATGRNVEAVYTFPLPAGAVLLDVSVLLGEKKLTADIALKASAEQAYEQAIEEGDAAIMIEANADGSYTLNLGNLAANEECVISLHYARKLAFEHGGVRLQIPTVIAARFGNALVDAGLQAHQVTRHEMSATYPLTLTLRIPEDLSSALSSPSHEIAIVRGAEDTVVSPAQGASMDPQILWPHRCIR